MLQDESMQHFLHRPENRVLVEAHQKREIQQAIRHKEKADAMEFRAKVGLVRKSFSQGSPTQKKTCIHNFCEDSNAEWFCFTICTRQCRLCGKFTINRSH